MGSALAFPARENGNDVRLVGTHLDREIIEISAKTNRHPKFTRDFPDGIRFYKVEEMDDAIKGAEHDKSRCQAASELTGSGENGFRTYRKVPRF